jgi:hypothetical protein
MNGKRDDRDGRKAKSTVIVWTVAICLPLLLILSVVGFLGFNHLHIRWEESHDIEFDLGLWRSGSRARIYSDTAVQIDAPRIRMCRDFLAHQPWKGKTRDELETWLGKADNFPFGGGWDFNYWVGLQRGVMKLDSAWLCFQFDGHGKAVRAELKRD